MDLLGLSGWLKPAGCTVRLRHSCTTHHSDQTDPAQTDNDLILLITIIIAVASAELDRCDSNDNVSFGAAQVMMYDTYVDR